jgi:hypothetical protein
MRRAMTGEERRMLIEAERDFFALKRAVLADRS